MEQGKEGGVPAGAVSAIVLKPRTSREEKRGPILMSGRSLRGGVDCAAHLSGHRSQRERKLI